MLLIQTETLVGTCPECFDFMYSALEMNPKLVWQWTEAIPGSLATSLGSLRTVDKFPAVQKRGKLASGNSWCFPDISLPASAQKIRWCRGASKKEDESNHQMWSHCVKAFEKETALPLMLPKQLKPQTLWKIGLKWMLLTQRATVGIKRVKFSWYKCKVLYLAIIRNTSWKNTGSAEVLQRKTWGW